MKKLKRNIGLRKHGSKAKAPGTQNMPHCRFCKEHHEVTWACTPKEV